VKELAQPLPGTTVVGLFFSSLVIVVLAFFLGLVQNQGDWASGATWGGMVALVLGALYLAGTLVRMGLGRRATSSLLLGTAATLVLVTLGGTGLIVSDPLHLIQARAMEASHNYGDAVTEYLLAGRNSPASHDVARAYDEWGESLVQSGLYAAAVDKFAVVINSYPGATAEVQRAWHDLIQTYTTWINGNSTYLPYDAILSDLPTYVRNAGCDPTCLLTLTALEAQAYFQYGVKLAGEQKYGDAITQFETLTAQFSHSPYAPRAHKAAASAYYALGQSQIAGPSCSDAVGTFRTLAKRYADTPEGTRAKAALAAPVRVMGHILDAPVPPPTMYLSRLANPPYFSDNYRATLDGDGQFTFPHVVPATYYLSAILPDGTEVWEIEVSTGAPTPLVIPPLCPLRINSCAWGGGCI
jgi:TolA-binding protein